MYEYASLDYKIVLLCVFFQGLQTGTREMEEMGMKFCHSLLSLTKDMKALYSRTLISNIDQDHSSITDHKSHK